jgi:hypothetical protein
MSEEALKTFLKIMEMCDDNIEVKKELIRLYMQVNISEAITAAILNVMSEEGKI